MDPRKLPRCSLLTVRALRLETLVWLFLVVLFSQGSVSLAQTTLYIPQPYDPVRSVPLDSKGYLDCDPKRLGDVTVADCLKARKFYKEEFGTVDLRFSTMMDDIRPHPKYLIVRYLSSRGVDCATLSGERRVECQLANSLFQSLSKEEQGDMIASLETTINPLMIVPLDGDLKCDWTKQRGEELQQCLRANSFLRKMNFTERRAHNSQASNLTGMLEMRGDIMRLCRGKK